MTFVHRFQVRVRSVRFRFGFEPATLGTELEREREPNVNRTRSGTTGTAICGRAHSRAHGSKRVPGKNVRMLGGHPMLAYTIAPALESGVFESVIVSTDSEEIAGDRAALRRRGAVPAAGGVRRRHVAGHRVARAHAGGARSDAGATWDCFSLLRPTSPFRTADTIRRAWAHVHGAGGRRFAARGREVRAASGQDVGRARRADVSAAAVRSGGAAVAQHAVSGAAAGVRAERLARDRVDARRAASAGRLPATCWCRSSPKATRGSTSTTRTTGWWPSGCLPTGSCSCRARGSSSSSPVHVRP